ncbi:hypothetical protein [Comamonas sp.]|uniref:hypothetical protein n=1 Tax=Comamonas sp. TaxID=34028 RepID=UPI002FC78B56
MSKWNTVSKRFRRWVKAGVSQKLLDAFSDQADMKYFGYGGNPQNCKRVGLLFIV